MMLAFVTFALGFGELMIAAILPAIAADLHASIALAGQLVTVYALTFALLAPPLAVRLRTRPAKAVLIGGLLVVAAANGVAAGADAIGLLLLARIVAAIGSAVATPLAIAAVDRVASAAMRGRAHGIVFTGFSLAAMLGVPLGAVIAARFGWRWTFAGCAGLAAAAAVGTLSAIPPGTDAAALTWSGLVRTLTQPAVRRALIVSAAFLSASYTVFTYFRPYFGRAESGGVTSIVWLFAVYGAVGIVGTLLGGWAVDRFGARPTLLASIAGSGITFAALPFASRSLTGSSVGVALWALTSWGFAPAVNRQLEQDAREMRDVAFALNLTAFNIGIAGGSALGGAAIAVGGISNVPYAAAALCAVAFGVAATGLAATARPC